MTAIPLTDGYVKIALPTREELRALFAKPSVMITAIICGMLLAVSIVGAVVFLAWQGKDSAVIGVLVASTLAAVGSLMNSRLKRIENTSKTEG